MKINYQFLPAGTTVSPEPLKAYLDIGNNFCPGVIDNHVDEAVSHSASYLTCHNPDYITKMVDENSDEFTIVVHKYPDFDSILSAYLATKILNNQEMNETDKILAELADAIDSGKTGFVEMGENNFLLYFYYLQSIADENGDKNYNTLMLGFKIIDRIESGQFTREEILKGEPFKNSSDFDEIKQKVNQDSSLYEQDYNRSEKFKSDIFNLEKNTLETVDCLYIKNPQSLLFKYWARQDSAHAESHDGFVILFVNYDDRRYIISIPPESSFTLRGLGHVLENEETVEREKLNKQRIGENRPGYNSPDPWYDGRNPLHHYTIIDTPVNGTVLSTQQIRDIVISSRKWLMEGFYQCINDSSLQYIPENIIEYLTFYQERKYTISNLISQLISIDYSRILTVLHHLFNTDDWKMLSFIISSFAWGENIKPPICARKEIYELLNETEKTVSQFRLDEISWEYEIIFIAIMVSSFYARNYDQSKKYGELILLSKDKVSLESLTNVHHYLGMIYSRLNFHYQAIAEFYQSLDICEKSGLKKYKSWLYDSIGLAFFHRKKFKNAEDYYKLSEEIKVQFNDKEGLAITYGNMGRLYQALLMPDKALEYFRKDLEISREINDFYGQIIMLSEIGSIIIEQGDVGTAMENYQKSLDMADEVGNPISRGFAMLGIANCHYKNNKHDRAYQVLEELEHSILAKSYVPMLVIRLHRMKGLFELDNKNFKKAAEFFNQAYETAKENNEHTLMIDLLLELGKLYGISGDTKSGIYHIRTALRLIEETGAYSLLRKAEKLLHEMDEKEWILENLRRFIGDHVIEMVNNNAFEDEETISGNKRIVTILFSDIRGFTTFSENLLPEELIEILNEFLSHMTGVIIRNNGSVDKFIGDAIMANFLNEEHTALNAKNSVLSAWLMKEELNIFNQKLIHMGKTPLNIGIGINTGEVIAGVIGSSERRSYTVIGDPVNLASRIEGLTKIYGTPILISEFTHNEITSLDPDNELELHFREVDIVKVKGKTKPVKLYELWRHGSLSEREKNILQLFNEAKLLYSSRDFLGALHIFHKIIELYENPRMYGKLELLYTERCIKLISSPPPDNWDGITAMTTK